MKLPWIVLRKKINNFAMLSLLAVTAVSAHAAERGVKSRVMPGYPEMAKRMRVEGPVVVEATVDADGKVTEAKAINGNRMLTGAAEDAVHRWKFDSGDGTAVVNVTINFKLPE